MKHDRQIGIRVGLPAFFALELEDVYKHAQGAHRALAFPDFLGFLIGLGLEAYRKGNAAPPEPEEAQECGREVSTHNRNTTEPYRADFRDFPDDAPDAVETLELLLRMTEKNGHDITLIYPDESGDYVRGYVAGQIDALRLALDHVRSARARETTAAMSARKLSAIPYCFCVCRA